jgi:site-specific recombinase XerD
MLARSVKAALLAMMGELAHRRHDTLPTRGNSAANGRTQHQAAESPTQAHVARRSRRRGRALDAGAALRRVQYAMGHADPSTTKR